MFFLLLLILTNPPKNIQTSPRATSAGMDAHGTTPANGTASSFATTVPTYAQAVTNNVNNITPALPIEALNNNPITTVLETLIPDNMTTTTEGTSQVHVQEQDSLHGLQSMKDIELSLNGPNYSYDNRELLQLDMRSALTLAQDEMHSLTMYIAPAPESHTLLKSIRNYLARRLEDIELFKQSLAMMKATAGDTILASKNSSDMPP
ncbi:uncharacterized protein EV154DRAFT_571756 [Mucor mucedo]|uniref:uncharacterized protein n=1 Tax=Mucor mucedo TaxID=29922 RepID=UPI00221FC2E6|nr:uncharacterized protein EV154DRAFT_571756 [Mucor mucedo]KAI7867222.1 hypothetical protein EV154DRAFT_571756 [Mucor mucedo]